MIKLNIQLLLQEISSAARGYQGNQENTWLWPKPSLCCGCGEEISRLQIRVSTDYDSSLGRINLVAATA